MKKLIAIIIILIVIVFIFVFLNYLQPSENQNIPSTNQSGGTETGSTTPSTEEKPPRPPE